MITCKSCQAEISDNSIYCNICGKKQVTVKKPKVKTKRGNGKGGTRKRGKTYQARCVVGYKVDNGKSIPIYATKDGFKTQTEAENYIPSLKIEYSNKLEEKKQLMEKKAEISRMKPTIKELWEKYLLTKTYIELSNSKKCAYKIAYNKLSDIHERHIDTLNANELKDIVERQAPTYYPAKDMKNLLSILYNLADDAQDNFKNLSSKINLPELNETKIPALTKDELNSIWKEYNSGNSFCGYILLMSYTGMMPGELLKLQYGMIDFDKQEINGCGLKTKTRQNNPIYFGKALIPIVHNLCKTCSSPDDLILNMSKNKFEVLFKSTLIECGCRELTPYSCRHTTATLLEMEKTPGFVQKVIMRHYIADITDKYKDSLHIDVLSYVNAITVLPEDNTEQSTQAQ